MQAPGMEEVHITRCKIRFCAEERRGRRAQIRSRLHPHADELHDRGAVEHLHDGARGARALEERVGDEHFVQAVDEGKEVCLGEFAGGERWGVCSGEGAAEGAAEWFGDF